MFNEEEVTFEALGREHWQLTRAEAGKRQVVLMIEDTTELDYTPHPSAEDLGPIGNGGGQGMLLHNTLALDPNGAGEVLGLSHQILFCRQPAPADETVTQRKHRDRESQIWGQSVEAVGSPPAGSQWVHVCDRGADNFEMFDACRKTQVDFVIRMAQNRRCVAGHDVSGAQPVRLIEWVRTLPAAGEKTLHLRRRRKRSPREAQLRIAYSAVTLLPPWLDRDASPCPGWVVRVWEPDTPSGEDPIEWILLTSVPVESLEDAMTISHWYSLRWLVEEYHMCLKTGCKVEQRELKKRARLEPCIAILGIVAVQLLQLKLTARNKPNAPATACAPPLHVQLL
ncbi:MAG: IS4 family transposase, partial [Actinomycetota bacterium]|nr:IS4 family transposase [Actinomycetota bacterium]